MIHSYSFDCNRSDIKLSMATSLTSPTHKFLIMFGSRKEEFRIQIFVLPQYYILYNKNVVRRANTVFGGTDMKDSNSKRGSILKVL